jgi:hypothetical protein
MNVLLLSMPDYFEHMPPVAVFRGFLPVHDAATSTACLEPALGRTLAVGLNRSLGRDPLFSTYCRAAFAVCWQLATASGGSIIALSFRPQREPR